MRTMTVAEAVEWADDVIDRVDAPGWYGQAYSTCDAVKWDWDNKTPDVPGCYATTHCWDVSEGMFPGANYFNGAEWEDNLPVCCFSSRSFASWDKATEWAYEHDAEEVF